MILSLEEVQRLTDISELSSLFSVEHERDVLSKYLSMKDIDDCISAGSTNVKRLEALMLKLIRYKTRDFFNEFVEYFARKAQAYKDVYLKLKYGISESPRDQSTQADDLSAIEKTINFKSLSMSNVEMKQEDWIVSPSLKYVVSNDIRIQEHQNMFCPSSSNIGLQASEYINTNVHQLSGHQNVFYPSSITIGLGTSEFVNTNVHQLSDLSDPGTSLLSNTDGTAGVEKTSKSKTNNGKPPKKIFQCSLCDKQFLWLQSYKCHMVLHTGKKPYSCELCGQGFSSKCNLRGHQRVHSGELRYECQLCGRRFPVSHALSVHMHSHTGTYPFQCDKCEKGFKQRIYFTRHMLIHHNQENQQ